ncbi:MAG: hypothetical protein AAB447_00085 [Patescibacteria group bacterium]
MDTILSDFDFEPRVCDPVIVQGDVHSEVSVGRVGLSEHLLWPISPSWKKFS